MSIVEEAVCWDGCYAEVLLYGMFSGNYKENSIDFDMDAIRPLKKVKPYNLIDEIGVINGNRLDLFSIRLKSYPEKIDKYLNFLFNQLYEVGALASWTMFDGAFHYEYLLTSDVADQIYGFQINGHETMLALEDNIIKSTQWSSEILNFRCKLSDKDFIV